MLHLVHTIYVHSPVNWLQTKTDIYKRVVMTQDKEADKKMHIVKFW